VRTYPPPLAHYELLPVDAARRTVENDAAMVETAGSNVVHIRAREPWWRIPWREIAACRELLWFLARRDLTIVYKQSVLGPVWMIVTPLVTTLVFTVVFSRVARLQTDGLPAFLFYLSGTLFWNYFQGCLMSSSATLLANAHVFSKVYFPRLVMPLSATLTNLVRLGLGLLIYAGVHLSFAVTGRVSFLPSWGLLALPLVAFQCALVGLGAGLWLAALTAKYRDLQFATPFLVQLWMYATPVVYPASYVRSIFRWMWSLNPMTPVVEAGRAILLGRSSLDAPMALIGLATGAVLCFTGVLVFQRVQRNYLDSV
jgi:lipopolysaccharide transport system permease protein